MTKMLLFLFFIVQVTFPVWSEDLQKTEALQFSNPTPVFQNYLAYLGPSLPAGQGIQNTPLFQAEVFHQSQNKTLDNLSIWFKQINNVIDTAPNPGLFYIGIVSLVWVFIYLFLPSIEPAD